MASKISRARCGVGVAQPRLTPQVVSETSRGVQQHEVNSAADALLAQQVRPTVERVRMKIGHGSPNTVAPMLERWFADLAPRLGLGESSGGQKLPPQLLQGVQDVWKAALEQAVTEAKASLSSECERLAARARELEQAQTSLTVREQAAAEREQLQQAAVERAQRLHDEAMAHAERLQSAVHEREVELAKARDSITRIARDKDAEARDRAARLDALSAELARIQQRADGNERRLLEEVDRARQELKSAEKRANEATRRLNDARAERDKQHAAFEAQVRELQVERGALTERLAASEQRAKEFQAWVDREMAAPSGGRRMPKRSLRVKRKAIRIRGASSRR